MADKISMPSSGGGLVRYFEEYKSRIRFRPGNIVVLAIIVIIIMIVLHIYGGGLLGI